MIKAHACVEDPTDTKEIWVLHRQMELTYTVDRRPEGWSVSENGAVVGRYEERVQALQIGRLLTLSAKAAGRAAKLFVRHPNGQIDIEDPDFA